MPQIPETIYELTVGQLSARSGAAVSALHFYRAWYRHITLAMAALAYLTATRATEATGFLTRTPSRPSASDARG